MTITLLATLDHVVINVRGALDQASAQWKRLGFSLTERGHHSLGTSNHLSIFHENYVELLGFDPEQARAAQELKEVPIGLNGLVFKTTDARKLFEEIRTTGLRAEHPVEFHRPVRIAAGQREAAFRTVRLGAGLVKDGRTFFCDYLTPELVWRDEWQKHPNEVVDVIGFVIASADPVHSVALYQRLFGSKLQLETIDGGVAFKAGRAHVQFITPGSAEARFGPVETADDGSERNVALIFATRSLSALFCVLSANNVPFVNTEENRIVVRAADALGVALEFFGPR